MVTFNHVALYVRDLEAMRAFYETHFGGVANRQYHNPVTGLRTYFLSFPGSDARLELMSRPGFEESVPAERAGWAHVSFTAGSREAVDALTEQLRAAGCVVMSGPRVTGDGYYEAGITDPEGNLLEIVA